MDTGGQGDSKSSCDGDAMDTNVLPPALQLEAARNAMLRVGMLPQTPIDIDLPQASPQRASNSDETCSDDATSDRRSKSERKRVSRGKNKIQPVVEDGEQHFVCPLCKATFGKQHELTMHIRAHNNGGTALNSCTLCGKQLSSQSSLDRHMLVHSGERPFCCRICSMSFTTNGNMHRHMAVHEKDMPAEWKALMREKRRRRNSAKIAKLGTADTSTSSGSCNDASQLQSVASGASALGDSQGTLDNLGSMWLSQVPFLQSLSNFLKPLPGSATQSDTDDDNEDDEERREENEEDGVKSETHSSDQGYVMKDSEQDDETEHKAEPQLCIASRCESVCSAAENDAASDIDVACNKGTVAEQQVELKDKDTSEQTPEPDRASAEKVRKCRYCAEAFATVNALRVHVRGHHGLSPYRCDVCDYTSVDKSTLVRHMRTHNGQRPFRCAECGYAFTTKANCERHIKTRHQKTTKQELLGAIAFVASTDADTCAATKTGQGQISTNCPVCEKSLPSMRALKKHVRSRHGIRKIPADVKAQQVTLPSSGQLQVDCAADAHCDSTDPRLANMNLANAAPFNASNMGYAAWMNVLGTFQRLASSSCHMEENSADCEAAMRDVYQVEPLDLTVKAKTTQSGSGSGSADRNLSVGTTPHDSGFSSAKTLSPDGALDMQADASMPFGPLALLTFYQNVLAASNQLAHTSASPFGGNQICSPDFMANPNGTAPPYALIADAMHNGNGQSVAPVLEECGVQEERVRSCEMKDNGHQHNDENDNDNESDVDVCEDDCDERDDAQNDSNRDLYVDDDDDDDVDDEDDDDGDGEEGSRDEESCTQNQNALDGGLSETEASVSKKKRNSYSDSPRRIQCPYCTRSFPWISSLKRHLITHTGQKPFRCPRCSLNFSTKSNRERHLLRKHGVKVHGSSPSGLSLQTSPNCKPMVSAQSTCSVAKLNVSSSSATLEDSELRDMTVADSIADSIGENLLKNASLVMSPNKSRLAARKPGGENMKQQVDMRRSRRSESKKLETANS